MRTPANEIPTLRDSLVRLITLLDPIEADLRSALSTPCVCHDAGPGYCGHCRRWSDGMTRLREALELANTVLYPAPPAPQGCPTPGGAAGVAIHDPMTITYEDHYGQTVTVPSDQVHSGGVWPAPTWEQAKVMVSWCGPGAHPGAGMMNLHTIGWFQTPDGRLAVSSRFQYYLDLERAAAAVALTS